MAWDMPSTPFKGVLISWLMLARKVDLARLAASAASFATCSAWACRSRSVTSKTVVRKADRPSKVMASV